MRLSRIVRSRRAGILISCACYVVAIGCAWLVCAVVRPGHPLLVVAVGDLVATVVVFFASVLANNSSIYDPYWSVKPFVIALYYAVIRWPYLDVSHMVALALVALYSVRLTSNFYRGWQGLSEEDFRYKLFRQRFTRCYWVVSFFGIHLFPTVMVYLGCLPLYWVFQSDHGPTPATLIGALVMLGAVALAFVADEQLRAFRKASRRSGTVMDRGVWKHVRHPNYLGEILFWWGLYVFALGQGAKWWSGLGALAITCMFVFVSVPLMENHLASKYPSYKEYQERTPALLPWRVG